MISTAPFPAKNGAVPGLPIETAQRNCNNRSQSRSIMSEIYVTKNTFFERLYLVLRLHKIAPWFNFPIHPQPRPSILQLFLNFREMLFPRMAHHFFCHHDSSSNLAKSRYPLIARWPHTLVVFYYFVWRGTSVNLEQRWNGLSLLRLVLQV